MRYLREGFGRFVQFIEGWLLLRIIYECGLFIDLRVVHRRGWFLGRLIFVVDCIRWLCRFPL